MSRVVIPEVTSLLKALKWISKNHDCSPRCQVCEVCARFRSVIKSLAPITDEETSN